MCYRCVALVMDRVAEDALDAMAFGDGVEGTHETPLALLSATARQRRFQIVANCRPACVFNEL